MSVFKCKMCGGNLEVEKGQTICICEYCGTKQTLPKLDDEKRAQLYDRANYFRRQNEFDKAMGIYEMILSEDKEDSECYWSIVLCRYGIEYVEDQGTHKRIPTVNRAQYTSIFDDKDYNNAIKFADSQQKELYEAEAKRIDSIQKGILDISSKESPFDVFICYKETDSNGNRTKDSVYAQDIYSALTKEGYKVFFSRITLEDKLGSAYEPYIFAALNSAKVMLVIGTSKENFNAVWVKNEWSRYLSLIKAGKSKTLIPVYKDVLPYDMPEEFQFLQSQDIGKVGAVQDVVRGVKKLIEVGQVTETQITGTTAVIVDTMLKRANEALSRHDWEKAMHYYENMLDYDDKNENAYLGKLLVDFKAESLEKLEESKRALASNKHYKFLIENANEELKNRLRSVEATIEKRITQSEAEKKRKIKKKVKTTAISITFIVGIALVIIVSILIYQNVIVPKRYYDNGVALMNNGSYDEAIDSFNKAEGFEDSELLVLETNYLRAKNEAENEDYAQAIYDLTQYHLIEQNYKDSCDLSCEWEYLYMKQNFANGKYGDVVNRSSELRKLNYKDTNEIYLEACYLCATDFFNASNYPNAITYYDKAGDYKDAKEKANESKYQYCVSTKENPNEVSRRYIKELCQINYKDATAISKVIFAWKADVSIEVSLRLGVQTGVSFSAKLSGGDGGTTKIKFVISSKDYNDSYCDNQAYSAGDTASCGISSAFVDVTKNHYTVKVYDENGNLIGAASGIPKE